MYRHEREKWRLRMGRGEEGGGGGGIEGPGWVKGGGGVKSLLEFTQSF
jgi:hypothetical protein